MKAISDASEGFIYLVSILIGKYLCNIWHFIGNESIISEAICLLYVCHPDSLYIQSIIQKNVTQDTENNQVEQNIESG